MNPRMKSSQSGVIWFTGLPASGKTTLAAWVADKLRQQGRPVEQLDGDIVRDVLADHGFTRDDRNAHVRRMGFLASRLEHHGVTVLASFVSPHETSRRFVRELCQHYLEVYVATPLRICELRDRKGLYARARRGEILGFTGIDAPYEVPAAADVTIDLECLTVEDAGRQVMLALAKAVPDTREAGLSGGPQFGDEIEADRADCGPGGGNEHDEQHEHTGGDERARVVRVGTRQKRR